MYKHYTIHVADCCLWWAVRVCDVADCVCVLCCVGQYVFVTWLTACVLCWSVRVCDVADCLRVVLVSTCL